MSDNDRQWPTQHSGNTDPMFPSPYWTLECKVTFDGTRKRCTMDLITSQWFTEKSVDSWSTEQYSMDALLSALLPAFAEALVDTADRVSPF